MLRLNFYIKQPRYYRFRIQIQPMLRLNYELICIRPSTITIQIQPMLRLNMVCQYTEKQAMEEFKYNQC